MKKLNNKGFAISTVIYGLSVMGIMIVAVLLAIMAQNRSNTKQLSKTIENELNDLSKQKKSIKAVEYITGDGNHYIDTGYKPTPSTGVYIDYKFANDGVVQQQRLFSVNSNLFFEIYVNASSQLAYAYQDTSGNYVSTGVAANTTRTTIEFNVKNDKKMKINSNSYDISGSPTLTSSITMKIFTLGGVGAKAKANLYSFKIYEDNVLVREFVPVKRSDGISGLYEKNTEKFHTFDNTIEGVYPDLVDLTI